MASVPASLYAVDGQVLINQSTLNAAGGTYTITQPGSYKLSGNLQAKDQNTSVILISSDHVTLDLNGFSILGTADCSGDVSPCANSGFGKGVVTLGRFFDVTIRNGTIQGMGGRGIDVTGDSILVEYMHVRNNGENGIVISRLDKPQFNAIVQHNNVQENGLAGIIVGGGRIVNNVVTNNFSDGIEIEQALGPTLPTGTVIGNVVTNNGRYGLFLKGSVNYIGNSMAGNVTGNVFGGFNQGQNVCGGAACPGAVF
jgi:hypothetical protein